MDMKKVISLAVVLFFVMASPAQAIDDEWTIQTYDDHYHLAKAEPEEGAYLGAYLLQEKSIDNDMITFNNMVGKDHVTYFKYVGYGKDFPMAWAQEVRALGGIPHIAWEPNSGLDKVRDDDYLQSFAREMASLEAPVFVRFASEMNGGWVNYHGDPGKYKEKWRLVHDVLAEKAPQAMMLWSVFTFPENQIMRYYPGDDWVDWVGVNIYNVPYHNDNLYEKAQQEDPLRLLDFIYDTFSARKPIHISEYGASNYATTDGKHHTDHAVEKIERLYGQLPKRYPRVKAITYFNVNTLCDKNMPYADRRINNYAVTTDPVVLGAYQELVAQPHYINHIEEGKKTARQTLTFNYRHFLSRGRLYVDRDFYENNMGLKVLDRTSRQIRLSDGQDSGIFPLRYKRKNRSFYGMTSLVRGISLREVADHFDYQINLDYGQKMMTVFKP